MRNGLNKACILKDSETLLRLLHVIFHIFYTSFDETQSDLTPLSTIKFRL